MKEASIDWAYKIYIHLYFVKVDSKKKFNKKEIHMQTWISMYKHLHSPQQQ